MCLFVPSPMQVSFVIPLYNCLSFTRETVASLQATLPRGLAHEIILVDDGSTDGTREWLAELTAPFRVVLNERNLGYAAANNRGAALATGKYLALLNNDLVLTPGWLEPMLGALQQLASRAGLVGNVQRNARTGAIDHAGIFINLKGKPEHAREFPSGFARFFTTVLPADAVTGACLLLERSLWQQLGGFDVGYVNGCEDVDLCFRAGAAGRINAVALRSVIGHHVSTTPGRKVRNEENTYRLTRRWRAELVNRSVRRWSRHYYELSPPETPGAARVFSWPIWLHAIGLRQTPPPEAISAMNAAIDAELARWGKMFGT